MNQEKIKAVNIVPKSSHSSRRKARLAFWQTESLELRRKYRKTLTGASVLTFSLMLLHILLSYEIYRFLAYTNVHSYILRAFLVSSVVFGIVLLTLLNIGGRHLALMLYRSNREIFDVKINAGELFYAFGGKPERKRCTHLLKKSLKKYIWLFILSLIPYSAYILFGVKACVLCALMLLFIIAVFYPYGCSVEWLFLHDRLEKTEKNTMSPRQLSKYAMLYRTKESRKLFLCGFKRMFFSVITFFGLIFFYFPYIWTTEAVRAECISSELVSQPSFNAKA